jgi:hypothetical protein
LIIPCLIDAAQAVSPYYFAYEDLLEDWRALQSQGSGGGGMGKQLPAEPNVSVPSVGAAG